MTKPPVEVSGVVPQRQGACRSPADGRGQEEELRRASRPPFGDGTRGVGLGAIAVRAPRGAPEKSVEGLDFSGIIEGSASAGS